MGEETDAILKKKYGPSGGEKKNAKPKTSPVSRKGEGGLPWGK